MKYICSKMSYIINSSGVGEMSIEPLLNALINLDIDAQIGTIKSLYGINMNCVPTALQESKSICFKPYPDTIVMIGHKLAVSHYHQVTNEGTANAIVSISNVYNANNPSIFSINIFTLNSSGYVTNAEGYWLELVSAMQSVNALPFIFKGFNGSNGITLTFISSNNFNQTTAPLSTQELTSPGMLIVDLTRVVVNSVDKLVYSFNLTRSNNKNEYIKLNDNDTLKAIKYTKPTYNSTDGDIVIYKMLTNFTDLYTKKRLIVGNYKTKSFALGQILKINNKYYLVDNFGNFNTDNTQTFANHLNLNNSWASLLEIGE